MPLGIVSCSMILRFIMLKRGYCNLDAGFGVNRLLAEGRFSGGRMDPKRRDSRRNQTCRKPDLLLQRDLLCAVSWFLTAPLSYSSSLELSVCPLNVFLSIFCLTRRGDGVVSSLAVSQLFLWQFLKQNAKVAEKADEALGTRAQSWKEDWSTCKGALALLEGVVRVAWVKLPTTVTLVVLVYERWDNNRLPEVFHPFLIKSSFEA